MDFFDRFNELAEASEIKETVGKEISKEASDKFDKLMGDGSIEKNRLELQDKPRLDPIQREDKFNKLFDTGDFFKKSEHNSEKMESKSSYELKESAYETDDNGLIYKKNGKLLPNIEYIVNGSKYKTNLYGNIISCDSNPKYTEEGSRNMKEQKEAGGEERQEDDDGGHIIAKILGGAEGEENLVPMRRTLNRGDYKRMENEIAKALQEGKKVTMHIDIEYDGDSSRPSKFRAEYIIDDKKTVCEFDNVKGSTDLLDSLGDKISDGDYERLKQNIKEMKEDECDAAITSVKTEYDESGNPVKVTVGILEESTGTKTYKEYDPR